MHVFTLKYKYHHREYKCHHRDLLIHCLSKSLPAKQSPHSIK